MGAEATSAARRLAASQLEEFTVFETDRRRWIVRALLSLVVCAAASGCATVGDRSYAEVRPRTEVVRTTTSFTEALRCMDGLFVSHGVHDIPITSVGIPDATGKVRGGIRDMLITSVAKMSERSGAFRYVDWEYDNKEIQILWQRVRDEDQLAFEREYADPLYSIRGAVTQFDQNVVDRRYGGGVAVEYNDYSGDALADWTNSASVMALDLNVSNTRTRAIIPGLSSNNSLAIDRRGGALSGALSSANLGVTFDFQATDAEGVHAGVRTLVELGVIESLGKLTRVPYWDCLQIAATEPGVMRELYDWWSDMSAKTQQRFAERALVANGYLDGPADGFADAAAREAISRYQAENDLVVSGRANFELYRSLIGSDRPLQLGPPESFGLKRETPDAEREQIPVREPVDIELYTDRGAEPTYQPMELLHARVQVSGNAYLRCYYQDAAGSVMQVFPNRFQRDDHLAAGDIVRIPGWDAGFQIQLEHPGTHDELMCAASDREIASHLPETLRGRDLVPLPVESLDEVAEQLQQIDRTGLSQARLPIEVVGM
jgi:hypothetical protein